MASQSVFELHSFVARAQAEADACGEEWLAASPWQDELAQQGPPAIVMQLNAGDGADADADADAGAGAVTVAIDEASGCPCVASEGQSTVATFSVVQRKLGAALAMTTPEHSGVLVNGLPTLGFTVLAPQDSVVLSPGVHSYITERIRPHVGAPTDVMIKMKCPFCKIAVTAGTRVVACRCGVVYHAETAESHPEIAEAERLNCLSKLRACLSCGRPVVLDEYLVWDPATLSPSME